MSTFSSQTNVIKQSVERETLNLKVGGSIPPQGLVFFFFLSLVAMSASVRASKAGTVSPIQWGMGAAVLRKRPSTLGRIKLLRGLQARFEQRCNFWFTSLSFRLATILS
jgi:hypothetical protein